MIGVEGLADKLRLNLDTGLTSNDLDIREQHFGTNKKEMPPRTPFCVFGLGAEPPLMKTILWRVQESSHRGFL